MNAVSYAGLTLVGWLSSHFLGTYLVFHVVGLTLHAGHVAVLCLVVGVTRRIVAGVGKPLGSADAMLHGLVLHSALPIATRTSTYQFGFASAGWTLALLPLLILLAGILGTRDAQVMTGSGIPSGPRPAHVVVAVSVIMLVVFRVSNILLRLRGVSNEARSLVIGGIEVHHFLIGCSLLVLCAVCVSTALWKKYPRIVGAGAGAAIGMIVDEWFYLALPEVSDDAYFGTASLVGAILLQMLVASIALISSSRGKLQSS